MMNPGAYVGRYRVEAFVDKGGMGEVFRAFDPMLERQVALKSIRVDKRRDIASLDRFQREAKILAQLNHPNICQVYDWIEAEDGTFMAMEWVPGVPLAQQVAEPLPPPLPLPRLLAILEAIGEALGAAHAHQIVHRDLKPGNILLQPDGGLKVLDFGLAKTAEERKLEGNENITEAVPNLSLLTMAENDETQAATAPSRPHSGSLTEVGTIVGTLGYMSPEQINLKPLGPPSDIFAFGIVAHELLTGRKPFEGEGVAMIQAVKQYRRIPLPTLRSGQRCPKKLARLLDRMLAFDPTERPSAPQVVEILQAFRRPLPAGLIASLAAAAALLLAGAAYFMQGRGVIADLTRERPARIAILPLDNGTGDPTLDALLRVAMPDMLGAALQDSNKLEVIDPEAVAKACEAQKFDPHRPLEAPQAERLARTLGSQLFLVGGISRDHLKRVDTYGYLLLDPHGKVRHQGTLQQATQTAFLPNAFLVRSAASLLKAVDPQGTRTQGSPTMPFPPQALDAFAQGVTLLWKGDFRKAEGHLFQCAYSAPQMARGVAFYARCLQRLSKGEALPASQWALLAAQKARDRNAEAYALQVMADLARERGDRGQARSCLERALELSRQGRDQDRESSCWKSLGLLADEEGKLEEAETCFQKALLITKTTGNQRFAADFLTNLANLALTRGDLNQAELRYREILRLNEAMQNRAGEALALNNLGVFLLTAQRVEEAKLPLERALAIRTDIGDGRGEAHTLRNLGILQQMQGHLLEARTTQQQTLTKARQLAFALGEAHALYRLADLDRLEGHFLLAAQGFKTSAALFETRGGSADRDDALAAAAECQARARPARLAEALALLPPTASGKFPRTTALRARAWIHWAQGKPTAALYDLDAALRDPEHQAPEGRAEMTATLKLFRKGRSERS